MMRFRITLILLALNIAVFGLLIYLEKRADVQQDWNNQQRLVLEVGLIEATQRITMTGQALPQPWVIEQKRDSWQLVEPLEWRANPYAISRIIAQLQVLEWDSAFSLDEIKASGQTLADYGLESPSAMITLQTSDGQEATIKFGSSTEVGQRLYIMPPKEDRVFVVKRSLIDGLTLDLEDLRDKQLFDMLLFDLDSLSITAGNAKTSLSRQGQQWSFQIPIQTAADPRAVDAALAALTGMQVLNFPAESVGQTGLNNPQYEIQIGGSNRRQTLLLGENLVFEDEPSYYAQLQGNQTTLIVPAAPVDNLLKAQETLRERRFFQVGDMSELSSIELVDVQGTIQLQRLEDGQWQVLHQNAETGLVSHPADTNIIEKTVLALKNIRADRFYSDAPSDEDLTSYGLINASRRIVLKNGSSEILWVGRTDKDTNLMFARNPNARFVYLIQPESLYPIPFDAGYYRDRVLNALPGGASIASIQLEDLKTGKMIIDASLGNGTTVQDYLESIENNAQRDAQRTLFEAAQAFPVKLYMGNNFKEESFDALGTPMPWVLRMTVTANLQGGGNSTTQRDTYWFTQRMGGSAQYGGHNRTGELFALPQHIVDALERLNPNTPIFDPKLLEKRIDEELEVIENEPAINDSEENATE